MEKKLHRKILFFCLFVVFFSILFLLVFIGKSYAEGALEWRPSVEINKAIAAEEQKYGQNNQKIQELTNFIKDYEASKDNDADRINALQQNFDNISQDVEEHRDNLEETSKNSFSVYFANKVLDDVVGNDIVTSTFFKWGVVQSIFSLEDDNISKIFDEYYKAKDELDEALSERDELTNSYLKAKEDLANAQAENAPRLDYLNYWHSVLEFVLENEAKLGAAGESKIEPKDGYFCNPCPDSNGVSGAFGEIRDDETRGEYTHKGNDLSAPEGTPIYACADGEVIETAYEENQNPTMGQYVKIKHENGYVSIYMHCSKVFVPNGVKVHKGDNIALVGNTGDSYGAHLHWQVEKDGNPINGLDLLKPQ